MTADSTTSPQLRDYQLDIVQQIFDRWFNGQSSVAVQLPTGAGYLIQEINNKQQQQRSLFFRDLNITCYKN